MRYAQVTPAVVNWNSLFSTMLSSQGKALSDLKEIEEAIHSKPVPLYLAVSLALSVCARIFFKSAAFWAALGHIVGGNSRNLDKSFSKKNP